MRSLIENGLHEYDLLHPFSAMRETKTSLQDGSVQTKSLSFFDYFYEQHLNIALQSVDKGDALGCRGHAIVQKWAQRDAIAVVEDKKSLLADNIMKNTFAYLKTLSDSVNGKDSKIVNDLLKRGTALLKEGNSNLRVDWSRETLFRTHVLHMKSTGQYSLIATDAEVLGARKLGMGDKQ